MKYDDWLVLEERILELFNRRCVKCWSEAVTAHHIVPRSIDPSLEDDPDNLVAVCYECHEWSHTVGTRKTTSFWRRRRRRALAIYSPDCA